VPSSPAAFVHALAALALGIASGAAGAQAYPDRVVRFVAPFSPGGVTDVVSRPLAQRLSVMWNQQVIVENRPGAGGSIGAELVAKARPDGYTLLMLTNTHLVSGSLYRKLPYDAVADFTTICLFAEQGSALVVHPSIPATTFAELVALARAQPKKLNYASSGNGSSQHLFASLAFTQAGIELTHVPYKGSGPAMTDLLSGLVPVSMPAISNALPHIQTGKLRVLAVSSPKRSPSLPDVPTLDEVGLKGYDATGWFGIGGPKGLPPEVVTKVYESVIEAVRAPEVQRAYATQGIELRILPPAEFGQFWRTEAPKWARAVRESGATVD
jgi:tripartite-type tricarboxylate transporter receptor subunit TctC